MPLRLMPMSAKKLRNEEHSVPLRNQKMFQRLLSSNLLLLLPLQNLRNEKLKSTHPRLQHFLLKEERGMMERIVKETGLLGMMSYK